MVDYSNNKDQTNLQSARVTSGTRNYNQGDDADETNTEWYKPDLGDIPIAPLTRKNREKIHARELQIQEKEAELDEILKAINIKKQERAVKDEAFKA